MLISKKYILYSILLYRVRFTAAEIQSSNSLNISLLWKSQYNLMSEFKQRFQLKCMSVIYTFNKHSFVKYGFPPEDYDTTVQFTTWYDFNQTKQQLSCDNSHPLYVIRDGGNVRTFLKQVTLEPWFSDPVWLMFIESASAKDLFSNLNVPYNCQFFLAQSRNADDTVIREVYRVAGDWPLQELYFGDWNPTRGLRTKDTRFFVRRNTLDGLVIRGVLFDIRKFNILEEKNNKIVDSGFVGKVWSILENEMKFRTNMVVAKDKTFGRMTNNGSWNGIIGMLLRDEVDMALTIMVWMSERAAILDYVTTVGEFSFRVFIQQPSSNLKWKYLGMPVDRKLWLASLPPIFLIVVLQLMTTSFFTRRHNDTTIGDHYTLLDSLFIALSGFLCGQAQPMTPASCSLRVLLLTIYITGWLLMALYSGKITSSLAVRKVTLPFNSMEGILADGSYQFTVLKNSAQYNILSKARGGLEQQVFTQVMNQDLRHYPESSLEGLQQVCGEPRVAFLSLHEMVTEYILEVNCSIAMIPKVFFRNQMSFTSRRGSPYIRLFNYKILQLHSGGIINKLRQDTWPKIIDEKEDRPIPVELNTVIPIFAVLVAGLVSSTLILFLECCIACLMACYM